MKRIAFTHFAIALLLAIPLIIWLIVTNSASSLQEAQETLSKIFSAITAPNEMPIIYRPISSIILTTGLVANTIFGIKNFFKVGLTDTYIALFAVANIALIVMYIVPLV